MTALAPGMTRAAPDVEPPLALGSNDGDILELDPDEDPDDVESVNEGGSDNMVPEGSEEADGIVTVMNDDVRV